MEINFEDKRQNANARYQYYFKRLWRFYQKPIVKVSLSLLLTIFTISFFAIFAISPTLNTIGELLRTIEDRQETLAKLKDKSAALATAQSEYSLAQPHLPLLEEALPEDRQIKELLVLIEALAAYHNLNLSGFSLTEDVVYPAPEVDADEPQLINFTISASADYNTLSTFAKDVTRLNRVVRINTLNYSQPGQSQQESQGSNQLELSLNATAFYIPSDITNSQSQ